MNIQQQLEVSRKNKQEEKTIVYVLVKKPSIDTLIDLEDKNVQKSPKPEVYFIKYKAKTERPPPVHEHWETKTPPPYGPPSGPWNKK